MSNHPLPNEFQFKQTKYAGGHRHNGIIFALCLALSLAAIFFIDWPLHDYVQAHLPEKWRGFFAVMTMIGYGAPWYIIFSGVLFYGLGMAFFTHSESRKRQAKKIVKAAIYLLIVLAATGLIVTALKIGIGRFRPSMLAEHGLSGFSPLNFAPGQGSYPSGHSQVIFAAMIGLHFVYPRYDFIYFAVAVLVAVSRLMIGVHFLGDILLGSAIGGCGAFIVRHWFVSKWGSIRLVFGRDKKLIELD